MIATHLRPPLLRGSHLAEPGTDPPARRVPAQFARATAPVDRLADVASALSLLSSTALFDSVAAPPRIRSQSQALEYPTSP